MGESDTEMSDSVLLRQIAADIAFLRAAVEPLLPLAEALRGGNGQVDAIRAAGLRKTLRKVGRDAARP